jgi:hypothetical protein
VSYPLYAALKGELFPGAGHVSLLGAIEFQLHSRSGSGSVFAAGSSSNTLVKAWLFYDSVLPLGGILSTVLAVFNPRLWAPAVAVLMLVLAAVRPGGYLPAMYVEQALPFLAIVLAGAVHGVIGIVLRGSRRRARARARLMRIRFAAAVRRTGVDRAVRAMGLARALRRGSSAGGVARVMRWLRRLPRWTGRPRAGTSRRRGVAFGFRVALVAGLAGLALAVVGPQWYAGDRRDMVADVNAPYQAAASWLRTNLPRDAVVVTDDVLWLDVVEGDGFPRDQVIWFYKLDLDPEVAQRYPGGWRDVDFVVSSPAMRDDPDQSMLPNLRQALSNSQPVITFGTGAGRIEIRQVIDPVG